MNINKIKSEINYIDSQLQRLDIEIKDSQTELFQLETQLQKLEQMVGVQENKEASAMPSMWICFALLVYFCYTAY